MNKDQKEIERLEKYLLEDDVVIPEDVLDEARQRILKLSRCAPWWKQLLRLER